MNFITLVRLRKKLSKADMDRVKAGMKKAEKTGAKTLQTYFTLGRYDMVIVSDCPDEKTHMMIAMQFSDLAICETMVAVPSEEIEKMMD